MTSLSFEQIYSEFLEQLAIEARMSYRQIQWLDRRDPVIWPWRKIEKDLEADWKQKWIHEFLKRHAAVWEELAKK